MTERLTPEERRHEACVTCCKVICALFLPPVAVYLEKGCGCEVGLNVVLTLLAWIPGVLHAFFIILGGDQYDEELRRKREARKEQELRDALSRDTNELRQVRELRAAEEAKATEGMGMRRGSSMPTRNDPTTTPLSQMATSSKEPITTDPTGPSVLALHSDGTVANPPAKSY